MKWVEEVRATLEEPHENVWSNIFYVLAAVPYLLQGTLVSLVVALCVAGLGVGSWLFHSRMTRTTHLLDHLGMHTSFISLVCYVMSAGGASLSSVLLVGATLVVYICRKMGVIEGILLWIGARKVGEGISLANSQAMIALHSAALIASVGIASFWLLLAMGASFALAFVFHGGGHDTPTGFGASHGAWHFLTALGMALPALFLG